MTTEQSFLAAIRANPTDDVARLVYADWLEEQADAQCLARARYLRLDCRLAGLDSSDRVHDRLTLRLRKLARRLPVDWKSVVARVPVEACSSWEFVCPKRWDRLEPTTDSTVRKCTACNRTVYYCETIDDARHRAGSGDCVAVDLRVRRHRGDLEMRFMTLGIIAPSREEDLPEEWRDSWGGRSNGRGDAEK